MASLPRELPKKRLLNKLMHLVDTQTPDVLRVVLSIIQKVVSVPPVSDADYENPEIVEQLTNIINSLISRRRWFGKRLRHQLSQCVRQLFGLSCLNVEFRIELAKVVAELLVDTDIAVRRETTKSIADLFQYFSGHEIIYSDLKQQLQDLLLQCTTLRFIALWMIISHSC